MFMTKNSLFLIFICVALVFSYWFYQKYGVVESASNLSPTQAEPLVKPTIEDAPPVTQNSLRTASVSQANVKNELQTLEQELDQERKKTELQKQTLEELKSRQALQTEQLNISLPSQISSHQIQIRNLADTLQDQRLAEGDLNQAAAQALREHETAAQTAKNQFDSYIASLSESLQQTRQEINYWTNAIYNITPEKETRLQDLQNLLAEQSVQLELLREQRTNIDAEKLTQERTIGSISQQQKMGLIDNQDAIQNEIGTLREEIGKLQTVYSQTRMSLMPLSQQIRQDEKAYVEQLQKMQALETSLENQKKTLSR